MKKIFISADFEGSSGITNPHQCFPSFPEFDKARRLWIGDINAIVEGAFEGGADEVVVNEAHANMNYLDPELLHPKASFISGYIKDRNQMEGLDDSFSGIVYMGHSMAGTVDGVLAHTYMMREITAIRINGTQIGEFGLNAIWGAYYRVPFILSIGDDKLALEAKKNIPGIETIIVKNGISQFTAHCRPLKETREMIKSKTKRVVEICADFSPQVLPPEFKMEIDFCLPEVARLCEFIPTVERISGKTVSFSSNDYQRIQHIRIVCTNLALLVSKTHF